MNDIKLFFFRASPPPRIRPCETALIAIVSLFSLVRGWLARFRIRVGCTWHNFPSLRQSTGNKIDFRRNRAAFRPSCSSIAKYARIDNIADSAHFRVTANDADAA